MSANDNYLSISIISLFLQISFLFSSTSTACKTQQDLITEIRANSTANVFPVSDPSQPVYVKAAIDFLHLLNVDIVEQSVMLRVWSYMEWKNELIHWDPDDFCGINDALADGQMDLLWFPDIIFPQVATNEVLFKSKSAQMRVLADGSTFICRYATMGFTCSMNSFKFPYDKHECEISMKADADTVDKLNITMSDKEPREFIESDVWRILSYEPNREMMTTRTASGNIFSLVQYKLIFQRKGNFIFSIIFLPSVIINVLCCSTFFLPCSSGEKIGFTVTLFLAQSVNLMIFSDFLPHGGNSIPWAAQYSIISSIMTSFSVLYGIWAIRNDRKCHHVAKSFDQSRNEVHVLETFPTLELKKKEVEDFTIVRDVPENELKVNRRQHGKDGDDLSILKENKSHRVEAWVERSNAIHPEVRSNNLRAREIDALCAHKLSEIVGMLFSLIMVVSTTLYSTWLLN